MKKSPFVKLFASLFLSAALVACGGGGSSSSGASTIASADPIDPVMPTALISGLSFNGVAAVGLPIADGLLRVSCANGARQTTTTAIDGSYSVTMATEASLPCMFELVKSTGTPTATLGVFTSVATKAGVVNVTPLTTLMVDYLQPGSVISASPLARENITPDGVAQAQTAIRVAVKSQFGVDLSAIPDLISSPFTATTSNVIDKTLESYKTAVSATTFKRLIFSSSKSNSQARFNVMFRETETAVTNGEGTAKGSPAILQLQGTGSGECSYAIEVDGSRLGMVTGSYGRMYFPALSAGSHTIALYMGGTTGGRSPTEGTASRQCSAQVYFLENERQVFSVSGGTTGTRPVKWIFKQTLS